jgi:hypothetical protein
MHPNAVGDDAAAVAIAAAILANVPVTITPAASGSAPSGGASPGCAKNDSPGCPGFCSRHPRDRQCHVNDECFNRHIPGCRN